MRDKYHYLSGEEFFNIFQDRIPEDLQPRIEFALANEISEEDILKYKDQEYSVEYLEDQIGILEDEIVCLREDVQLLTNENKDLRVKLLERWTNNLTPN